MFIIIDIILWFCLFDYFFGVNIKIKIIMNNDCVYLTRELYYSWSFEEAV